MDTLQYNTTAKERRKTPTAALNFLLGNSDLIRFRYVATLGIRDVIRNFKFG